MAGTEERCGAAPGTLRSVRGNPGVVLVALATLTVLARMPVAYGQVPEVPSAPAPGGGGAAATPGGAPTATPGTATGGAPTATPGTAAGGGPAGGNPPNWVFTPAIEVDEAATDNVFQTTTSRQSDLVTTISPSLFVTGSSPRLQGTFDYSPQAFEHVTAPEENQVIQNLLGQGTLTAVPNLLFFDGSATSSEASRIGGVGYGNNVQIPTSVATQTTVYSGSPYARLHFGDDGDAELRYTFSQMLYSGETGSIPTTVPGEAIPPITNGTQNEASAKYNTGAAFNRLQFSADLDYLVYDSTALTDSRNSQASVGGSYQLTRTLALLANGGYQRLIYPGQPSVDYTGPTWSGGFTYQPRDDRVVSLSYGRNEGQNSFTGNMNYALTQLTKVSASYSEQDLTEQQEELQGLGLATQTTPGATISQGTGLPFSIDNPNLALQNAVSRVQNLSAGISMQGGQRNQYTLTFNRLDDAVLGVGGFSQTTSGGLASWNRDMSPNSSGSLSLGYSTTVSSGAGVLAGTMDTLTVNVSYSYNLTPTLTAGANYTLYRETGGGGIGIGGAVGASGTVLVDTLTVTLRKTF